MKDPTGREIRYLRIAVTGKCDLHCPYCGGGDGASDALTDGEITAVAAAAARLGVEKLRITGGEPLCRPGLPALCRGLAAIPGIREVSITTNATNLEHCAAALQAAGVKRLNISLDTLRPARYRTLTGGDLDAVFRGIRAAWEAGLRPLKLNVVLMGGVNDDEIPDFLALARRWPVEVRFIELMPLGRAARLGEGAYLSCEAVRAFLPRDAAETRRGVALMYAPETWRGQVGLIRPMSRAFCSDCNRLRLTADGKLKPCLHTKTEIDVRGLSGPELERALLRAAAEKPACRPELHPGEESPAGRSMGQIGG